MKQKVFTVVSLFAGAGGMDIGFERQGFKTIWANDYDKDSCQTFRLWSSAKIVEGDIAKVVYNDIPESDIILGGFPCQGFSLAGPRKLDDKRNTLYQYFVKLVELKQPYAFIAENVKGLLTLGDGLIFEAIIDDFKSKGYIIFPKLVNAADYGVPQDRYRIILVGLRKDLKAKFTFPKENNMRTTLKEALSNIPTPKKEDICHAPFSSRYISRNRRRDWGDVSFTIPAMAKQVPLHPSSPPMKKIHQDLWEFGNGVTRRFSWQEAAAIQTFPEEMEFCGDLTSKYRQIGNAVPCKLAESIASSLHKTLTKHIVKDNSILVEVGA